MFGRLNWRAIPFDQPIPLITSFAIIAAMLGVLVLITVKRWWPYLWREWITSVDHKRIGVMYFLLGVVMLIRGFADAIMMRTQQAAAIDAPGYLTPEHYDQIFTAHGTIMILFGAMPLIIGIMNFLVPLQLGVRDVAFPTFNSVGFWLTAAGALLVNVSLFVGEFARTGWLPYPPLSEATYTPGVGVDYYLWAVQISGVGTLITGINIVTTILKMRCPGMALSAHADLLLDRARLVLADRGGVPDPDRDARHADPRSLPGLALFHQHRGRQSDDVREPDLGLGTPEEVLHSGVAGLRRLFRDLPDLFRQAAVRLPLDGRSDAVYLRRFDDGVAASLLHHGRGRSGQHLLRHLVEHHRGRDRREGLQLDLHHVRRPRALRDAHALVVGVHLHLPDRRPDRCPARRAARRLSHSQLDVSGGALPQCDRGRGGVRRVRRHGVLVSKGVRVPTAPGMGQGCVLVRLHRLLGDVHAALCAGPAGHDAALAAHQCRRLEAVALHLGGWRPEF